MKMNTGSFDSYSVIPLEGIDLTTAARQVSLALPEQARLSSGDLLDVDLTDIDLTGIELDDVDLCSVPLMDTSGLSNMLSGDLSALAS